MSDSPPAPVSLLRAGVLEGRAVALAGGGMQAGGALEAVSAALVRLGARVELTAAQKAAGGQPPSEAAADDRAAAHAPLNALVFDAAGPFGRGGRTGLMAVLERCWESVIEVADTLIAAPVPAAKIVFIAPRPGAGELAGAARAALENLARSLSVEWARHPVTACAVWPGAATSAGELSELVCFLLSPAGDYFSGCRFELGGLGAAEA